MLIDRLHSAARQTGLEDMGPLIVTKENARKAIFTKLNRGGGMTSSRFNKRMVRRGLMTRGNSFVGFSSGQRVVVKARYVKHKAGSMKAGGGAASLRDHLKYISRPAAGKDGEKAVLFNEQDEGLDRKGFLELCQNDRHHWRFIISPENGDQIEDFHGYVRSVMKLVEKDLQTSLQWTAAVHYDTDDVHAHVIVRGVNDRGEDLVIGQDYVKEGFRRRAQEVATELLGERSLEEIRKSQEKEVDALRVTSLDRFMAKQAGEGRILDVREKTNFGKSVFYEGLIKERLRFLATTGLAVEQPPGVYMLKEDYQDELRAIAQKNEAVKRLYPKIQDQARLDGLAVYAMKDGQGPEVTGRIVDKGIMDELYDRKYVVVEDMSAKLHFVAIGDARYYDKAEKGSLVTIKPGTQATGKADQNIKMIADMNGGIYDAVVHKAHVEKEMKFIPDEDREQYVDYHLKRLETLEKNEIVNPMDGGRYEIPADVIAQGEELTKKINEREKKRYYPHLNVLSAEPIEGLVHAEKKTWLDKELFKQAKKGPSIPCDVGVSKALAERRDWLVKKDLAFIQSNGEFALRGKALQQLDTMEVYAAGCKLAKKFGLEFSDKRVKLDQPVQYGGFVNLETGTWAIVSQGKELQLARVDHEPKLERGDMAVLKQTEGKLELQSAPPRAKSKGRTKDKDQEMGL